MSDKKLLAVAEIARQLDIPESTVHYWKNRFAQYLPSVGKGRQKRFRPEAVDVFRTISEMLGQGYSAQDVMAHLAQSVPVNALPVEHAGAPAVAASGDIAALAAAIGTEIAKALGESLKGLAGGAPAALDSEELRELRTELDIACKRVQDLETLRQENTVLLEKMEVMEAEMIRLRRDRREMEKYLLDKMKSMAS